MYADWGPRDLTPAKRVPPRKVAAALGLLLEDMESGFVGELVSTERAGGIRVLVLEDRHGRRRSFRSGFGFLVEGEPVEIVEPAQAPAVKTKTPRRSASGSVHVGHAPARTARAARIWVEGAHDAELVEHIWGHDLRIEGIVVEPLHGADDLAARVRDFAPNPGRRLGVLLDHLVTGSKEDHIANAAMKVPGAQGNVLVLGHPFIDIWQAVKPARLGLDAWPTVPRNEDFKLGTLARLGWPHRTKEDVGLGFQRILSTVRGYGDLEPALLGRVEELIDFVTT
ncbi:MAG: DUF3097 family protein [Galactobacter sp.]|uniref:DUF3097 family protein n=1 Tax=Galactobacter sp. TaxID=2676125 RepID=UPI0025BCB3DB|nr:DUF3097 family protein [Galactobacter sp.]